MLSAVAVEVPTGRFRGLVESLPQVVAVLPHEVLRPSLDTSVPYSPPLEAAFMPNAAKLVDAAKRLVHY